MAGKSPTPSQCIYVGCCWNSTNDPPCYHSLPSYNNYLKESISSDGTNISLTPLVTSSPLDTKMHPIRIKISPKTKEHLSLLFYDEDRYVGLPPPPSGLLLSETAFNVKTFGLPGGKPPFSLEVLDKNTSNLLIGTAEGPLIASDWYWVITLKLPSADVYGWGGAGIGDTIPPTLKLPRGPLPLWAGGGRRPAHPFLIFLDDGGLAHGIFVSAKGPLEANLLPSGLLVLRAVVKYSMEIHILAGPTPSDVSHQVAEIVGLPTLPPYWALGLHTCRDDADDALDFLQQADAEGLPLDTDCLGLHALSRKSFEVDDGMLGQTADARNLLSSSERRYMPVQRPQINVSGSYAYTDGLEKDLFVKFGELNQYFVGTYDNGPVVYPSLLSPETTVWLNSIFNNIGYNLSATIPGCIIEDDSPVSTAVFGPNPYPTDDLKFVPRGLNHSISQGTLWFMSRHSDSVLHYEIHNSYGSLFGSLISKALVGLSWPPGAPETRRLVLGEWTYPGTGTFGGHGGPAKVNRTWTAMRSASMTALSNGLVGIPLSAGSAACGRPDEETPEGDVPSRSPRSFDSSLCKRWIQLGSLLPLFRVHLPGGNINKGMMSTLVSSARLRYSLLPYLYTQMYMASISGVPVARHFLFEYPESQLARDADEQFFLGPAVMVAPSFIPAAPTVSIVMPNGTWYEYPGGGKVEHVGGILTCMLRRDETPMFIRGGYILPMQDPGTSALASRGNPLSLLVALDCKQANGTSCAEGDLFVDDGVSPGTPNGGQHDLLRFTAVSERSVEVKRVNSWLSCGGNQNTISTVLDAITVFGAKGESLSGMVAVNGIPKSGSASYVNDERTVVSVTGIGADWCGIVNVEDKLVIDWA
ncbi:lysosomal alpha-glucosidase-like [Hetaerina americana]|uniref:lysosomal alpha-glucosidase-like n=1 Tax=Hetaerina americana TaxID=62018 RepID=UPI003A7F2C8B